MQPNYVNEKKVMMHVSSFSVLLIWLLLERKRDGAVGKQCYKWAYQGIWGYTELWKEWNINCLLSWTTSTLLLLCCSSKEIYKRGTFKIFHSFSILSPKYYFVSLWNTSLFHNFPLVFIRVSSMEVISTQVFLLRLNLMTP